MSGFDKRVLLVDDNIATMQALAHRLKTGGYTVLTAETGQDGIARVRENGICAVVIDQMLPDKAGLTLAQEIRALKPHLPVMLYTGLNNGELDKLRTSARFLGIGVFEKGHEEHSLMDRLHELVDRFSLHVSVDEFHLLLSDHAKADAKMAEDIAAILSGQSEMSKKLDTLPTMVQAQVRTQFDAELNPGSMQDRFKRWAAKNSPLLVLMGTLLGGAVWGLEARAREIIQQEIKARTTKQIAPSRAPTNP